VSSSVLCLLVIDVIVYICVTTEKNAAVEESFIMLCGLPLKEVFSRAAVIQ